MFDYYALKGKTLRATKEFNQYAPHRYFEPGQILTVVSVSNAGFRGFELQVTDIEGTLFSGVSIKYFQEARA